MNVGVTTTDPWKLMYSGVDEVEQQEENMSVKKEDDDPVLYPRDPSKNWHTEPPKNGEPYEILESDPPIYEYEEKKQSDDVDPSTVVCGAATSSGIEASSLQNPEELHPEWHKEPPKNGEPYSILFSEPPIYVYKSEDKQEEESVKSKQVQKKKRKKKSSAGVVTTKKAKRKRNKAASKKKKTKHVAAERVCEEERVEETDGPGAGDRLITVIKMDSEKEIAAEPIDNSLDEQQQVKKQNDVTLLQPPDWYIPLYWCHPAVLNSFSQFGCQQQQQMSEEQWAYYNTVAASELSQSK